MYVEIGQEYSSYITLSLVKQFVSLLIFVLNHNFCANDWLIIQRVFLNRGKKTLDTMSKIKFAQTVKRTKDTFWLLIRNSPYWAKREKLVEQKSFFLNKFSLIYILIRRNIYASCDTLRKQRSYNYKEQQIIYYAICN